MIPLKVLRRTEVRPYVTYTLILINVLVFVWELIIPRTQLNQMFFQLAVNACQITTQFWHPQTWIDMIRTMFLHGGPAHLFGNMLFLVLFGPSVEEYFGKWRFFAFYLIGGFAAAFTHAIVKAATSYLGCDLPLGMGSGFIPLIGASGAISAVMGGFILLHPGAKVRTLVPIFGPFGWTMNLPSLVILGLFFVIDLFNGILSVTAQPGVAGQVAVWAHVGGFITGAVMIFIATMWKPAPDQNLTHDEFD